MKKQVMFVLTLVLAVVLLIPFTAIGAEPEDDLVYGITTDGDIHMVSPSTGVYTVAATITNCINNNSSGPNGLAYDPSTNRIYYTEYPEQAATGHPLDGQADLYFIDFDTGIETFAGLLPGEVANADFYEGKYYYIAGGGILGFTDNLYEVTYGDDRHCSHPCQHQQRRSRLWFLG